MERGTIILAFKGTSAAVMAEALLAEAGIRAAVMPLPADIRAGCGIALRVHEKEFDAARTVLADLSFTCHNMEGSV